MKTVSDNSTPLISFIIPAYNAAKTIARAVDSVKQLSVSKEILVVENGSKDETTALLEEMDGIRLFHSEKGVSKARNTGIRQAAGEWLFFLDADDQVLPEIEEAAETLQDQDIWAGSYQKDDDLVRHTYENTGIITGKALTDAMAWMIRKPTLRMQAWAKFYRTKFIQENQITFNEALHYAEDSEFVIRALLKAKTLQISSIPVYRYKSDNPSAMRSYHPERIQSYLNALKCAEADIEDVNEEIRYAFRDYVIAQVNLMAVHDIFGTDIQLTAKERKARMKDLLETDVIRHALQTLRPKDLKDLHMVPSFLFQHGWIHTGGAVCRLRSRQNKQRYQKQFKAASGQNKRKKGN